MSVGNQAIVSSGSNQRELCGIWTIAARGRTHGPLSECINTSSVLSFSLRISPSTSKSRMKCYSLLLATISLFRFAVALPPSQDPFYVPPPGYENSAPGTILNSRPVPAHLRSVILPIQIKDSWQLLVRSTDSQGNPNAIVTTVMEPFNADPSKFVSYHVAEDSPSPDCAVSYALQVDSPVISNLASQSDMIVIQTFLEEGWYVQTPDYEGPKGAFTIGLQAAHAALDSVRATLASTNLTGIDSDAKTIFYGYSGGSIPSAWAATYQPKYAPELSPYLLGVATGGFVTDVRTVAEAIEGTPFAGLTAGAVMGWAHEYPGVLEIVKSDVTSDEKFQLLFGAGNQCLIPSILEFAFTEFFTGPDPYFATGYDLFTIPEISKIMESNTLALENTGDIPQVPMFIFHSRNDEVAPFDSAIRVYNNWCDWGIQSLEFAEDLSPGHVTEFISGAPASFAWMKNVFNGGSTVQGCTRTTRLSNLLYPGAPWSLAELLNSAVLSALQQPIGPLNGKTLGSVIPYYNPFAGLS